MHALLFVSFSPFVSTLCMRERSISTSEGGMLHMHALSHNMRVDHLVWVGLVLACDMYTYILVSVCMGCENN